MEDNRTTGNGALFGMATGGLLGLLFGAIYVIILGFFGACIGDYFERRQQNKRGLEEMEETNKQTRKRRMRERIANCVYGIGEWMCRRGDRIFGITYPSGPPKTREPIELANCCHIPIVISGSGMYLAESARDVDIMCQDCGQVWNVQFKAGSDVAKIEPIYIADKIIVREDEERELEEDRMRAGKTEQMADFAHKVWIGWAEHMLDNLTPENTEKWRNQIATPYSELSEEDKEKDRKIFYEWVTEYTRHIRESDPQGEEGIGSEGEDKRIQETDQATES